MEKQERFSPPAVGGSSLLVVFAVLCLSVFALLSLSTVQAERRMADASAQAVSAYYAADLQAEQIYAQLRSGETPPQVQLSGGVHRYTCPISQTQQLIVELKNENGSWEVLRWQAVTTLETGIDETLTVWDGTTP